MPEQVAFIDTETLGLDPDVHPIWEIGLIVDGQAYEWQLPVTARELALADPRALEITHFEERYLPHKRIEKDEAMSMLARLTRGRHLVGAVPNFDEERLRRLMWRYEIDPGWHYHLIDVETLCVGVLTAQGLKVGLPWDSTKLSELMGVDRSGFLEHSALGDARWAKALYEAVQSLV